MIEIAIPLLLGLICGGGFLGLMCGGTLGVVLMAALALSKRSDDEMFGGYR